MNVLTSRKEKLARCRRRTFKSVYVRRLSEHHCCLLTAEEIIYSYIHWQFISKNQINKSWNSTSSSKLFFCFVVSFLFLLQEILFLLRFKNLSFSSLKMDSLEAKKLLLVTSSSIKIFLSSIVMKKILKGNFNWSCSIACLSLLNELKNCITSLPLASTRWVWSILSSLCPLF